MITSMNKQNYTLTVLTASPTLPSTDLNTLELLQTKYQLKTQYNSKYLRCKIQRNTAVRQRCSLLLTSGQVKTCTN